MTIARKICKSLIKDGATTFEAGEQISNFVNILGRVNLLDLFVLLAEVNGVKLLEIIEKEKKLKPNRIATQKKIDKIVEEIKND